MPKCNQCDSVTINGVYCHEIGCPNRNKIWDDETNMWIKPDKSDMDFIDLLDFSDLPEEFEYDSDYWEEE